MCGIFGVVSYGKTDESNIRLMLQCLGVASAVRGTDASGYAWISKDKTTLVHKSDVPSYYLDYRKDMGIGVKSLMGHTRHTTQGNAGLNYNNHPFPNKDSKFALAHNGVIYNENEMRKDFGVNNKKNKIETDSYVAVQCLDTLDEINFETLSKVGSATEGSFNYSVLDSDENIWIVKGNNPLVITRIKELELIIYTSTQEIMDKALANFKKIAGYRKLSKINFKINDATIYKINTEGSVSREKFKLMVTYGKTYRNWDDYDYYDRGGYSYSNTTAKNSTTPKKTAPVGYFKEPNIYMIGKEYVSYDKKNNLNNFYVDHCATGKRDLLAVSSKDLTANTTMSSEDKLKYTKTLLEIITQDNRIENVMSYFMESLYHGVTSTLANESASNPSYYALLELIVIFLKFDFNLEEIYDYATKLKKDTFAVLYSRCYVIRGLIANKDKNNFYKKPTNLGQWLSILEYLAFNVSDDDDIEM